MTTVETKKSKPLNISLWVAQFLLAAMFLMAGVMKSTQPIDQLSAMIPWTKDVPLGLVRFIGAMELLAGVGLLLPSILRIKPILTPSAATGLVCVQAFAVVFHISRGEAATAVPMNLFLLALAVFVAWGRFKKSTIQPK
jgi:putative oxidoreductase